ncbi:hypothetical protein BU15DRAFT_83526 [Melanogaster broomeanus]|nr:hypothetical protein BU15DRAFT_83526 [Melanogaster broomeanus]
MGDGPQSKQGHNKLDLQGPTKLEPVLFPALLQRRAPPIHYNHQHWFFRYLNPHLPTLYHSIPPWPPFYAMAGPIRSTPVAGSARQQPAYKVQPPRPPNAWILYRSDRLKDLPPSKERRAQADVSKLISDLWKNEKEEVKLEYERMADARKAEHQRMYPSYRFQPMKKEDKERIREERKQEREQARLAKKSKGRGATAATTSAPTPPPLVYAMPPYIVPPGYAPPMTMPHPYMVPYQPEARFGPAGPSPPLSAASSPNDTSTSPDPQDSNTASTSASPQLTPSPKSQGSPSSSQPLPSSMLYPPQQSSLPSLQQPSPIPYAIRALPLLQSQTDEPSLGQFPPAQSQLLPAQDTLLPASQTDWNDMSSVQFSNLDSQNPEEFLNFDIAFNQAQSFAEFQQGVSNDGLQLDGLQGLLSMTGENGVFSLSNLNPSDLLAHPQGALEIAMGPQPSAFDFTGDLFANFDFSTLEQPMQANQALISSVDPLAAVPVPDDFTSLFQTPNNPEIQVYTAAQQRQPSMFTQDVMQFLNLEAAEGSLQDTSTLAIATTVAPQQVRLPPAQHAHPMPIFTQMTNTAIADVNSYVPPAGAIHSSTRRVAASWKPSFAVPDSPVEQPAQPWDLSAS